MYELLDAAGATLCDPLLIILLAVMMMPSGGSSYVFSGKTDDVAGAPVFSPLCGLSPRCRVLVHPNNSNNGRYNGVTAEIQTDGG